jgi:hypothetical protein
VSINIWKLYVVYISLIDWLIKIYLRTYHHFVEL